jgi:transcriptional regulator GlxA family with amidase domain
VANDLPERHIAAIMAKLEMCSASESSSAVFRRKELAYRLLSLVFATGGLLNPDSSDHPRIQPGVVLLQQSYLENIPVTHLAEVCGMSVSSFRRQFGLLYGVSPVQYRNSLRLQRARALLLEGNCSVTEAAYASGFENLGYFCRYYKRITGESPGQTKSRGNPTE